MRYLGVVSLNAMRICSIELTVQISLSALGNSSASLLLVLLKNTDLLQSLEDLSVNRSGSIYVVGWAGTTVAGGTVNLAQTADTDSLAEVHMSGDGSGTNVEPVDGLRWELLGGASLDGINPT